MDNLQMNNLDNYTQNVRGSFSRFKPIVIKDCINVLEALKHFCASQKNTQILLQENQIQAQQTNQTMQNIDSSTTIDSIDFRIQKLRFFIEEVKPSQNPINSTPKPSFADVVAFLDSNANLTQMDLTHQKLESSNINSSTSNAKIELNQAELDALVASPLYQSPCFRLSQVCDIEIFPRLIEPLFSVSISKQKDRVDLCFDEAFCVVEDRGFLEDFFAQVESALVLENVVLALKNELRESLSSILESIAKNPLKKKEAFCLLKSREYEPTKQVEFHFLPKDKWESLNGIAPQNAAFGVKNGEQIGILTKSKLGKAGRNVLGEYMLPSSVESIKIITTKQDDIQSIDTHQSIIYNAKKDGFVRIENGEFKFIEIPNGAFSTRNIPPLLAGDNIDVEIACRDIAEDGICAGVWCEVRSLKVRGCVGENTRIKAQTLIIEGSTHKSAHIKAYAAQIRTHKGKLECTHCAIENLDNGEVISQNAKILRANGAKISADNVTIYELKRNNKIFFAKSCVIVRNQGGQNEMIFSLNAGASFMQWSKKASMYFATQKTTLKKLTALANVWGNERGGGNEFLEKMKGFSEYQKQIALRDEAYAMRYKEALASTRVTQVLEAKIQHLQKQILTLRNQAITSLKNGLRKANIAIKEVWGYDNYAFLLKPNLSVFGEESSVDSSTKSSQSNALDTMGKDMFFSSVGLDEVFSDMFASKKDYLDSLQLQEGQGGGVILDENLKLKISN